MSMDEHLVIQQSHSNQLKTTLNTWSKAERRGRGFVMGLMEELKENWKGFAINHQELLRLKTTETNKREYFTGKVFENTHATYFEVLGQMLEILNPVEVPVLTESTINVPRLSMPKFSGKYEDWRSFYDLFSVSVHNKVSLSPVHKLQMLKSLLEGEAEALLRHFQITDSNYNAAWKTLIDRYDNKRVLVNTQLRKLMSQPAAVENSDGIKRLLDTTLECQHALRGLGIDLSNWDPILNYIVTQRLPSYSHTLWEQNLSTTEIPKFEILTQFLEKRFRSLEFQNVEQPSQSNSSKGNKAQVLHVASNQCWNCNKSAHKLKQCPDFLKCTARQRSNIIKKRNLCKKCFAYSHKTNECPSSHGCNVCNRDHHTLLHWEAQNTQTNVVNSETPSTSSNSVVATVFSPPVSRHGGCFDQVLLATALVDVRSSSGDIFMLRALLDNGSQVNLISKRAVRLLKLRKTQSETIVNGVGNSSASKPCSKVDFTIHSRAKTVASINIIALVMPTLTKELPTQVIEIRSNVLDGIELADPSYGNPGSIDLILSAEILALILLNDMKKLSPMGPMAQHTKLGWILSGSTAELNRATCALSSTQPSLDGTTAQISKLGSISPRSVAEVGRATCALSSVETSNCSLDLTLRSFWEVENIPLIKAVRDDDARCIEIFTKTMRRCPDGRYIVSLPFKSKSEIHLGSSRKSALSRFLQLERRFKRQPELHKEYSKSIQEYIELGHLKKVTTRESDLAVFSPNGNVHYNCGYLPHHGVIKESSSTTRLRVVFDASAKSDSGSSLNDCLFTGPVIQDTLMTILMRWRRFPVVMKADITQMYRQIWVTEADSEYQRILWREQNTDEIEDYRLTTVTFGVSSAPFLAIKTLQQLAHDEKDSFPIGSKIVLKDFYVDDLLSGADTVDECVEAKNQIVNLLRAGGFHIRKWCSNQSDVLKNVELSDREAVNDSQIRSISALGLKWSPIDDCFSFKNSAPSHCDSTKRTLLSEASKLFDPLGWLAPTVIIAKMLFQKLWLAGLEWDDPLPESIRLEWITFKTKLSEIERIRIPRWIGTYEGDTVELHGFCDASERAYSAVVYLRSDRSDGTFNIQLICAKTRVAPVKSLSIARLELCGALLLAQLLDFVKNIYPSSKISAWSDSNIVLAWLIGHPSRWKTFVANRVSEIQSLLPSTVWKHVGSMDNPADCASRGIQADALAVHSIWWTGPSWLAKGEDSWPKNNIQIPLENIEEKKSAQVHVVRTNNFLSALSTRYSSLSRLIRVTAYMQRWKSKIIKKESVEDWLSPVEIEKSTQFWIETTQMEHFASEIRELKSSKPISLKSNLLSLNPIIGNDSLLRVGGRLSNSNLSYNEQHPIILPSCSTFTKLLLDQIHIKTGHGGAQLMLAHLRTTYWVLNARNTIRHHVHKCVRCYRFSCRAQTQQMADLPRPRSIESRPFSHVGVDYAGPIDILTQRKPGRRQSTKGYICLFVCFATKAIHLELVSSLSTDSFLAAFNRFASRRGLPTNIYSDNGTNFVGAAKKLDADFKRSINDITSTVVHVVANKGVDWKFIPPSAPHFGGLWEAGVKSTKFHLKRIIGNSILTYEEMITVLSEIECCLNSRPLCPMSNDPSDLAALTPGHFLIGEAMLSTPRPSVLDINVNRLDRFQLLQSLHQQFWKRWSTEYLARLQQRPKWASSTPNIKVDDLVILKDDCLPPSKWALGRIIAIHPGADGLVRVATVKTAISIINRPIAKLCLLPSESRTN